MRRIVITAVEAPTQPHRTWAGPDHQLAEPSVYWFDRVRTWVEILTGQDLDPNQCFYDTEAIGAGLTFIEPPHENALGLGLTTPLIRPVSAGQWKSILAVVRDGEDRPSEYVLLRDARAAFTRRVSRRTVIDAAAALEIALVRVLGERIEKLPDRQRGSLESKPTLRIAIDIAIVSKFESEVTFKDLKRLSSSRNDAVHRARASDYLGTYSLLRFATDFLRAHGCL